MCFLNKAKMEYLIEIDKEIKKYSSENGVDVKQMLCDIENLRAENQRLMCKIMGIKAFLEGEE